MTARRLGTLAVGLGLGLALGGAATAAPSRRRPPPVDRDAEDDAHSSLWDTALDPARAPYRDKVLAARRLVDARSADVVAQGVALLDEAIALRPADPDAYAVRGDAHLLLGHSAACAADHLAAVERGAAHADPDQPAAAQLARRRSLGVCLARAGKLIDAERVLAEAAATGSRDGELWFRLGETRIALGKLDEAIAALTSGLEVTEPASQGPLEWMLAATYDRAREPALAVVHARAAESHDRDLASLVVPGLPPLGLGESEYLLGLARLLAEPANPELALVYLRRFVTIAPKSPWRRRAEEHLAELARAPLPSVVERRGNASLDLAAAQVAIRGGMAKMRACLAGTPGLVLEVRLTRVGPRTPEGARDRPRVWAPPPGSAVVPMLNLDDLERGRIDEAVRCVQPLSEALVLPAIKDRDSWYHAVFVVVGDR